MTLGFKTIGAASGVALASFILTGFSQANAAPAVKCHLEQIAELHVSFENNRPLVDAEINGVKVKMLVDTGASRTTIYSDVAQRAGAATLNTGGQFYGVGGDRSAKDVTVESFSVGGSTVKKLRLFAIDRDPKSEPDVAGLIGEDLFSQTEAEFDLSAGVVRLHKAVGCHDEPLAYWTQTPGVAPLVGGIPSFEIEVKLNNQLIRAELDSGAQTSVVSTTAVARSGAHATVLHTGGTSSGIGRQTVETKLALFDSFSISDETIKNAKLEVADLFGLNTERVLGSHIDVPVDDFPDMLLGADFFRSHRVLISNTQRKLYFTYASGPVFQVMTPAQKEAGTGTPAPSDKAAAKGD